MNQCMLSVLWICLGIKISVAEVLSNLSCPSQPHKAMQSVWLCPPSPFSSWCIQASVVGAPEPGLRSRSQTPSSAVLHHSAEGRKRLNDSGKCLRGNLPHQRDRGQEGWAGIYGNVKCNHKYFAIYKMLSATLHSSYDPVLPKVGTIAFIICPSTTKHYSQNQHCCVRQDLKLGQAFYSWAADEVCHLLAKLSNHLILFCNLIWPCPQKHFGLSGLLFLQKQLCAEADFQITHTAVFWTLVRLTIMNCPGWILMRVLTVHFEVEDKLSHGSVLSELNRKSLPLSTHGIFALHVFLPPSCIMFVVSRTSSLPCQQSERKVSAMLWCLQTSEMASPTSSSLRGWEAWSTTQS